MAAIDFTTVIALDEVHLEASAGDSPQAVFVFV